MFLMSNAVAANSPDQRSSSYQHLLDPRARENILQIFCNKNFIYGRLFQSRKYFETPQRFRICLIRHK